MNTADPVQTAADLTEHEVVDALNADCFCIGLDDDALRDALERDLASPPLFALLRERCPNIFAQGPVFVAPTQRARMAALVQAVESVVALPAYREAVRSRTPAAPWPADGGPRGVFFGYDFHVSGSGFGLIEINTNAGGAMLNAVLARAQRACCPPVQGLVPTSAAVDTFERQMVAMFRNEWRLAGHERPLRSIAIVDDAPASQYLYPEFLLFQQLFERHGIAASIADPQQLAIRDGCLWHDDRAIDLVYNRVTDFGLDTPSSAVLRSAWLDGIAVVTPHPQAHALYADKRNLVMLSDPAQLAALGVPEQTRSVLLDGIPRTEVVGPANAARLWQQRRQLFFKPFAGFGSRAAYRGDKLTQRVWQDITAGGYVAQALVAPGTRAVSAQAVTAALKFDVRDYVYDGAVQWMAARLYQGQTTNFRTPGGGFAPVFSGCADAG